MNSLVYNRKYYDSIERGMADAEAGRMHSPEEARKKLAK